MTLVPANFLPKPLTLPNAGDHDPDVLREEIFGRIRYAQDASYRVKYELGRGGRRPTSRVPWDDQNRLDCSGYLAWGCGVDRYQPRSKLLAKYNGGWISTDAIVYDAKRPKELSGFFTQIPREEAQPGDVVVYGDYISKGAEKDTKKQGHCAFIRMVPLFTDDTKVWFKDLLISHCSSTNYRKMGNAIQTTSGSIFNRPDTVFARFDP